MHYPFLSSITEFTLICKCFRIYCRCSFHNYVQTVSVEFSHEYNSNVAKGHNPTRLMFV